MTPKEQANELYELMFYKLNDYNAICLDIESKDECAKQCALVAVDEVINELASRGILSGFWYEVHLELKKL